MKTYRLNKVMLSPGNQWTDGLERAFMKEELVLIPEDTELPTDLV